MKKFIVLIVVFVVSVCANAQVSVSGDVAYSSKSLDLNTGLMINEEPAMIAHITMGAEYKKFSLSSAYSGHMGIQRLQDGDKFHMLNLSVGYKLNDELSTCIGYELTYTDNQTDDQFGHGVFVMAMHDKNRVSSTLIFFADPKIQNTYYIGSVNLKMNKSVSLYALGGYTNTKSTPWYGLLGVKYSKDSFFLGTYCVFDKEKPGPVVSVGLTF